MIKNKICFLFLIICFFINMLNGKIVGGNKSGLVVKSNSVLSVKSSNLTMSSGMEFKANSNSVLEGVINFSGATYVEEDGGDVSFTGNITIPSTSNTNKIDLNVTKEVTSSNGQLEGIYLKPATDAKSKASVKTKTTGNKKKRTTLRGIDLREPELLRDPLMSECGVLISPGETYEMSNSDGQDTSIYLGGTGTLKLVGTLKFNDNKQLSGNGTVDVNNNSFIMGGLNTTWGSRLTWLNAADIQLNSKVTLTGEWIFDGNSHIGGNGNILDLSSTGTILIQSGTTLEVVDLKIKGIGHGKILFQDKTAQLKLSYVDLELDRNFSVTYGGIYVEGPTCIFTKDKAFTMEQKGSMTVDGVTLWYDTGSNNDYSNHLVPEPTAASNPEGKNLKLLNSGNIRSVTNIFEDIRGNSQTLLYYHRTDSSAYAFGIKNNSNTMLRYQRTDSAALVYLVRTHSAGYAFGIKNNSNTMLRYQRTDSAALVYLVRTHSAGYAYGIKNNSNTMLRYQRTDSAALVYLVRTHSAGYAFGIKNNSNALKYGIKGNSQALLYLSRTHSNAYLYLIKNVSNALLMGSAETIMGIRANSQALLYLSRNNSNALLYRARYNSGTTILSSEDSAGFARYQNLTLRGVETLAIDGGVSETLRFDNSSATVRTLLGADLELGSHGTITISQSTDTKAVTLAGESNSVFTISLNGDLTLPGAVNLACIIIEDGLIIDGRGNTLTFDAKSSFSITNAKTLTLKNMIIKGLKGGARGFWGMGSTSKLKLQNVVIDLAGDWGFRGSLLEIVDTVIIRGAYKFIYDSSYQLSIKANSILYVDVGSTFKWNTLSNLFSMENSTSWLYLNKCTVDIPSDKGLLLTRGSLFLDSGVVTVNNHGNADPSYAFIWGDGFAENAIAVNYLGGATTSVDGLIVNNS